MSKLDNVRVLLGKSSLIKKVLSPINKLVINFHKKKMNREFRKKSDLIFHKVYAALDNSNIEFWPEFGTLLGIIRENDFLKHDFDFDFGAFTDSAEIIKQKLKDAGFNVHCEYNGIENSTIKEITFCIDNIQIDFFFFNKKDASTYCTYTFAIYKKSTDTNGYIYRVKEYDYPAFSLTPREFKNIIIHIPNDSAAHLTVAYGPNFMIPDPSFTTIHHTYMDNTYAESKYYN